MDYQSKYERIYYHKNNIKYSDRKFYLMNTSRRKMNMKKTLHDYYKNKCSNHNKLKTEKIERTKERDYKFINC